MWSPDWSVSYTSLLIVKFTSTFHILFPRNKFAIITFRWHIYNVNKPWFLCYLWLQTLDLTVTCLWCRERRRIWRRPFEGSTTRGDWERRTCRRAASRLLTLSQTEISSQRKIWEPLNHPSALDWTDARETRRLARAAPARARERERADSSKQRRNEVWVARTRTCTCVQVKQCDLTSMWPKSDNC